MTFDTALHIVSLLAVAVPAVVRALGYAETTWGRVLCALLVDVSAVPNGHHHRRFRSSSMLLSRVCITSRMIVRRAQPNGSIVDSIRSG